jgi:hypothetical protein
MRVDVTLRNERARQFQRLKEKMEEELGHEIPRSQALGMLMASSEYDVDGF